MKNLYTFLLVFTAIFCGINYVSAQTNVAGGNVSGTWTLAGSPYLINGSIQIPNGQTLTIEPGVTVNFQGHYKIYVQGRILAVGTVSDTITFTASDTTTGWKGIRFDNTPATNDSSKFFYCKIQYGKATISPDNNGGALCFTNFSKAIISNCTITNCFASANGAGISCESSSIKIINNKISNNSSSPSPSSSKGGGIYCINGSSIINNNTITYNSVANHGGGIYCSTSYSGAPNENIISNNIISHNTAYAGSGICCVGNLTVTNNIISYNSGYTGGGIYCSNGSIITYNTINNNSATFNGGGIRFDDNGTIANNTISDNNGSGIYSYYSSGIITKNIIIRNSNSGICCSYGNPTISNNTISNNIASNGGGIICSNAKIINNLINNNSATSNGGGIYCGGGNSPFITNNTISNNTTQLGGGLYCTSSSNPILHNNILWGNTASIIGNQVYLNDEESDPSFYFNNIQESDAAFGTNGVFYTGTYQNNIDSDPLFVAPTAGSGNTYDGTNADWSLQVSSPCINAGTTDTTGLNLPSTDIAGNPRISDGRIDIGAYEHLGTSINNIITNNSINIYPNPNNGKFLLYLENYESKNYTLEIYNITGQIIYSKNYENPIVLAENIDITEFESGIYLVKVTDGENVFRNHIIIYK